MNRSCRWAVPLVAGLIGCGSGGPPGSAPPSAVVLPADVGLQVVKMPELKKAIAAQKGKVVVMDVWADY